MRRLITNRSTLFAQVSVLVCQVERVKCAFNMAATVDTGENTFRNFDNIVLDHTVWLIL